jgi:hypothetical protein
MLRKIPRALISRQLPQFDKAFERFWKKWNLKAKPVELEGYDELVEDLTRAAKQRQEAYALVNEEVQLAKKAKKAELQKKALKPKAAKESKDSKASSKAGKAPQKVPLTSKKRRTI